MIYLLPALLISYLIGSIPTALIAGRIGGVDIRTVGSGNLGATNVYRAFGLKPYIAVLIFDIFKGFASAHFIPQFFSEVPLPTSRVMILCGFFAVLGHIFTLFAGFKGGKGVATAVGMMLALVPIPLFLSIGVYLAVVSVTHYVSLGSISLAITLPFICIGDAYLRSTQYSLDIYGVVLLLTVLIVGTHSSNIKRIMNGSENKTYFFGKRERSS